MSVEQYFPVSVVRVQRHCDCGGVMESWGICLTSDPPQYPHKCTHCGVSETFNKTYPYIEYEEMAGDKDD